MKSLFSYDSPLWNSIEHILHYTWLSTLWFLCCIPIITIGASTTALYSVALKYIKKEESYLTSSFFHAFYENWKQSTIIWLSTLVIGCFLWFGFLLYFRQNNTSVIYFILMTIFLGILLSCLLANIYIYPLLATFQNSTSRTILNAFIMSLTHLGYGIASLCGTFLILAIGFLAFPPILFLTPGLIACINSRFLSKVFKEYIPESASNERMEIL